MKRILIIADDLTGAAEIGGIALEYGLSSRIEFGQIHGPPDGAMAVDTDTRSLQGPKAASRLVEILGQIDPTDFDLIYKKTDSVLRGPVAAEIEAVLNLIGLKRCILAPQNPSRGRIIENGEYRIDGLPLHLTTFARDSEHPATTADVCNLVGSACRYVSKNQQPASSGISIGEGINSEDLRHWASCIDDRILSAGGADFFTAILQSRGLNRNSSKAISKEPGKSLIIFGSASAPSREFVAGIGNPICAMPSALLDPATRSRPARKLWVNQICEQLNSSGKAFVAIREEHIPDRALYLREVMAGAVAEVLANCEVANLFIEGGATAAAIVRWMGWREFQIVGHFGTGVVAFRNESAKTPLIVIKPGSYPWPTGIFE